MAQNNANIDAVEAEIDAVKNADSLADTPFSQLFHAARTSSRQYHTGVSMPVRVRDGELQVGSVVKTAQGEHHHVRDAPWDTTLGLPVKPFMGTRVARQLLVEQLEDLKKRHVQAANGWRDQGTPPCR